MPAQVDKEIVVKTVVMDIIRVGLAASIFILIGKMIFIPYNVPIASKYFAAI